MLDISRKIIKINSDVIIVVQGNCTQYFEWKQSISVKCCPMSLRNRNIRKPQFESRCPQCWVKFDKSRAQIEFLKFRHYHSSYEFLSKNLAANSFKFLQVSFVRSNRRESVCIDSAACRGRPFVRCFRAATWRARREKRRRVAFDREWKIRVEDFAWPPREFFVLGRFDSTLPCRLYSSLLIASPGSCKRVLETQHAVHWWSII